MSHLSIHISTLRTLNIAWIVVILSVLIPEKISGQASDPHNDANALMMKLDYGVHQPVGEMANRFGTSFSFTGNVEYILSNSLFVGLTFDVLFGNTVKEDVLSTIRASNSTILSENFSFADLFFRQRGSFVGVTLGKIFPINPTNNKTGIRIAISPGAMQHRVRFNDEGGTAPQIRGLYEQGYDRKTGGFAIKSFIGYQIMSRNRRMNFVFGLEALHGFTKELRPIQFDTQTSNTQKRFDQLYGLKVSWMLPFYSDDRPEEEIFY